MKKISTFLSATILSLVLLTGHAFATSYYTGVITEIGCDNSDSNGSSAGGVSCHIKTDGTQRGPSACKKDNLYWDGGTQQGRNILSILQAAFLSGKTVKVALKDTCFTLNSSYPEILYMRILPYSY